jgi:hypothetical protein
MGGGQSRYKEPPKGMKNVFQAGIGTAETMLSFPKTFKSFMIVGVTVLALVILVVIGTAAWGVGSGKIDVNRLADTAAEASKNIPIIV